MKIILAVFQTLCLSITLVIMAASANTSLRFDGSAATIAPADWQWLTPEDSPEDWQTIGANLDHLNWQPKISYATSRSQTRGLLRIDFLLTQRGAEQQPLFVIETPSAEHFFLAAMQQGKLFKQWELGSNIAVINKERPSTHTVVPLQGLQAGPVSILIKATAPSATIMVV